MSKQLKRVKQVITPALIAHGGAGGRAPMAERSGRRHGLISAVERGAAVLSRGGGALDAVAATIVALENDSLFNAGYGSVLTTEGRVEMDAAVMVAERGGIAAGGRRREPLARATVQAGGVVLISRVRNPILLARAVMEFTPHLMLGGPAAERLATQAGLRLCRPDQLISERAHRRWLALMESRPAKSSPGHGTVGAAALDAHGNLAAATSTGGVAGKLPGRIGDSAVIGAGLFAAETGAASSTGTGEAIMKVGLCREAITMLARAAAPEAALRAIKHLYAATGGEAGLVMVDSAGCFGYAHNAPAMEIAMLEPAGRVRYRVVKAVSGLR